MLRRLFLVFAGLFVLAQLVPYGWAKPNPPVVQDAPWPDDDTRRLARGACYACHSNETDWPVYSYVAPMSWLVRSDVESGRAQLNFSEWGDDSDPDDAAETIEDGSMPPRQYSLVHPDARLSEAEKRRLIAALEAMEDAERADDRSTDADDRSGSNRGPG